MIIDLKVLSNETRHFEFSIDRDWWYSDEADDQNVELDAPLKADLEIYKIDERFALSGEVNGELRTKCDRCLEPYPLTIQSSFKSIMTLPPPETDKVEIELVENDMQVGFITSHEVDLREVVREQVYLSLPIKSLCKENCKGLCPSCGVNLNFMVCQCPKEQGHPAFMKLKSLKMEE